MARNPRPEGAVRPQFPFMQPVEPLPQGPGGFMGSVNVLTETGFLEISRIVRKRLAVRVACADLDTGRVRYRPVTGWSCTSAEPEELLLLDVQARGEPGRKAGNHRALRLARSQLVYTPGGLRPAGGLRPGDTLFSTGTALAPWQEELVVGTLLGDGYIGERGENAYGGLACCHGFAQRDYLEWKYRLLSNVVVKAPSAQKLSPGSFAKQPTSRFTTRRHPSISAIATEFYGSGVKRPPEGVVARAGWLGIGVWFGDDGGCVYSNGASQITAFRFHTCVFTPGEADGLVAEMRAFTGLPWRRYLQNGRYPIITMGNGDGTQNNKGDGNLGKWVEMVRRYVPPMLAFKLRIDSCGEAWERLGPPDGLRFEPIPVRSVVPYRPAPHEDFMRYHLTVEGEGTFVAHGVVVGDATTGEDLAAGLR